MKALELLDPKVHIIPEQKDIVRAESLRFKSNKQKEAFLNKIKDPHKLTRRGVALTLVDGYTSDPIANDVIKPKLNSELKEKYINTCGFITKTYWDEWEKYIHTLQMKRYDEALKVVKAINKKVPEADARISTMCAHPYWNADGLFINFRGFLGDDAPYSGYNSGGPSQLNNCRPSYLGKNLNKIKTIVNRFDLPLYKSYGDFFIMLSIKDSKYENPFKWTI